MGTYKFLESNFKSTYCLLIFGFHCVTACQTDVSRTRLETFGTLFRVCCL